MKTKKSPNRTRFGGTVLQLSISPHGETEGVMLDTNSFVKIPPHSILLSDKIKVGSIITGNGVEIAERPNSVFYHAQVMIGKKLVADDSGLEKARSKSKEVHHARLEALDTKVVEKKTITVSRIAGIAVKPKGVTMKPRNVAIIIGSLRKNSFSRKLATALIGVAPDNLLHLFASNKNVQLFASRNDPNAK